MRNTKSPATPSGHPYAIPRMRMVYHPQGKTHLPEFVFPHDVLGVQSRDDLKEELKHYSHPMPSMVGSGYPNNPEALRYLVEWVYPTLRWYCTAFGVEVPTWLKGNHWADGLSDRERERYLGKNPLHVVEWREVPAFAGKRA